MVFITAASILFASVLPSVMGLTLNTPADTTADGVLAVTWSTVSTDPVFALFLSGPEGVDIATGVEPSALSANVTLGSVAPGTYTVTANTGDDIETVLSTSGSFTIGAAGSAVAAAGAGDNAAAGAAAAGAVEAAAPATAAPATAAKAKGKGKAAKGKAAKDKKGPRSVVSAKFGRRELYRD
ncbi:hypothetical protein DFH07DRAFT_785770 [Mycena maculata]|uniref:Uncharacterized protein n=1 Tax=Mycena maculata TaxID=230809 RepID=A0AAD7H8B4_9AGAR|nr:hypothetical protein DFH07DRAFT_785770 [Mycena maculata]